MNTSNIKCNDALLSDQMCVCLCSGGLWK